VTGNKARIISFSGIDGAGKSTQISSLSSWLTENGFRVSILAMWDDIVVGAKFREAASLHAFRGDQGIGTPERPLQRRDKNVTAWPLTLVRSALYAADAWSLKLRMRHFKENNEDVIIFDRYIYDEIVNLPLEQKWARGVARLLLGLAPQPDLAFIVDAAPEAACTRKPEYPLEFVQRNRATYLELINLAPNICVVGDGSIEETNRMIQNKVVASNFFALNSPMLPRCIPAD
jgi:thymidylate kinase